MPNRALTEDDLKLLRQTFASKYDVETIVDRKLDEKIGKLPTKDLFLSRMDKLSGEIRTIREEFAVHTKQHQDTQDQLDDHEKGIQMLKTHLSLNTS